MQRRAKRDMCTIDSEDPQRHVAMRSIQFVPFFESEASSKKYKGGGAALSAVSERMISGSEIKPREFAIRFPQNLIAKPESLNSRHERMRREFARRFA